MRQNFNQRRNLAYLLGSFVSVVPGQRNLGSARAWTGGKSGSNLDVVGTKNFLGRDSFDASYSTAHANLV